MGFVAELRMIHEARVEVPEVSLPYGRSTVGTGVGFLGLPGAVDDDISHYALPHEAGGMPLRKHTSEQKKNISTLSPLFEVPGNATPSTTWNLLSHPGMQQTILASGLMPFCGR